MPKNAYENISYNEFHSFIKKYIGKHVCLEAAPDKYMLPPSTHAESVKLRNPHDEKGEVEEITSNEERSEVRSSSIDHGMAWNCGTGIKALVKLVSYDLLLISSLTLNVVGNVTEKIANISEKKFGNSVRSPPSFLID